MRPPKGKRFVLPILNPFGYVKLHGSYDNQLCDIKEWVCFYKNTYISAVTCHRIRNLVSNLFKNIALLLACWICKISNLNIHEFQ